MIKGTALAELCYLASKNEYIAFDTEFSRVKNHYYPLPSLIQFSFDGKKAYLCDFYDKEIDWKPLIEILINDRITKVFHAVKQDLDVLEKAFQIKPKKVFDLQLASGFLGDYSNPSYNRLAKDFLGIDLDKKMQFSDWTKRPLSQEQLTYAASDVTHLYNLFPKIKEALGEKYSWSEEEMDKIIDQESFLENLLDKIALSIIMKKDQSLTPKGLWYLKNILIWREEMVMKKNLLREKILPTQKISKMISFYQEGSRSTISKKLSQESLIEPENFDQEAFLLEYLMKKREILLSGSSLYKKLQKLSIKVSQNFSLDKSLLAKKSDLVTIVAKGFLTDKFQKGWRYSLFGKKVENLL
jgi:ribonuclease D